jgi:hypothetical protein
VDVVDGGQTFSQRRLKCLFPLEVVKYCCEVEHCLGSGGASNAVDRDYRLRSQIEFAYAVTCRALVPRNRDVWHANDIAVEAVDPGSRLPPRPRMTVSSGPLGGPSAEREKFAEVREPVHSEQAQPEAVPTGFEPVYPP